MEKQHDPQLWERFCRLGEMIGDGLHHEEPWISKEYRKLSKILIKPNPEVKAAMKQAKQIRNKSIDAQMAALTQNKPCSCGGQLKQARSGSKIAYCQACNQRYKARTKK